MLDNTKEVAALNKSLPSIDVRTIFENLYINLSRYGKAINSIKGIFYSEIDKCKEYGELKDNLFAEAVKADKLGRTLSAEHTAFIQKRNFEFSFLKTMFIQENILSTSAYLSGLPHVSQVSASEISAILHEYV